MARFNTRAARTTGASALQTATDPYGAPVSLPTAEGGAGFARDAKSELFVLAAANLVGQDTFYETAAARDARFNDLVGTVALQDPAWTAQLIRWLRTGAHMRTAALVAAAQYAEVMRLNPDMPLPDFARPRAVIDSALQRADEPGEFVSYWMYTFGRKLPKSVKRGVADAMIRLWDPYTILKYDTASKGMRFGDLVEYVEPRQVLLTKAAPRPDGAGIERNLEELFGYLLARRHGRVEGFEPQRMRANAELRRDAAAEPRVLLDPARLRDAGFTWEDALSLAGDGVPRAQLWEVLIPTMGITALMRNLRNFDTAGVSDAVAEQVAAKFRSPAVIARSRTLPFQWYLAYREAPSLRWSYPLEQALQLSTANVPAFAGRSLILIDTSGSMGVPMSDKSRMQRYEAAAVFGFALAARQPEVDVFGFGTTPYRHVLTPGGSILGELKKFRGEAGRGGHGTMITESIRSTFRPGYHQRVFVFTDEQSASGAGVDAAVPADVPLYAFNLAGYRSSVIDTTRPGRVQLGGLTDATFRALDMVERGRAARWPWED